MVRYASRFALVIDEVQHYAWDANIVTIGLIMIHS
jgi:hypothetical protein